MHIGLLDDNPDICEYLTTALRFEGHTVTTHGRAQSLLESLFSDGEVIIPFPYDLILVDIFLPGNMSGVDACLFIRKAIPPEQLPIILMTASRGQAIESLKNNSIAAPVLYKPFTLRQLFQAITASVATKKPWAIDHASQVRYDVGVRWNDALLVPKRDSELVQNMVMEPLMLDAQVK